MQSKSVIPKAHRCQLISIKTKILIIIHDKENLIHARRAAEFLKIFTIVTIKEWLKSKWT